MRVVIVGAGAVGIQIARELIEEKRDVVIIEKNAEIARMVDNELDCLVVNADGTVPEVLRQVKTETADWFLALTGSDSVNIVACGLVASESMQARTIARVETPFYSSLSSAQQKTFGLKYLINPAMETAKFLVRILDEGFAGTVVPLHDGRLQLRTLPSELVRSFAGKSLVEIRIETKIPFLVSAVVRENAVIVPKGDFIVEETDLLYVLGEPQVLDQLFGHIAGMDHAIRRVLILGATRVSERLIECLIHKSPEKKQGVRSGIRKFFGKKLDITVMDKSSEDCRRLAREYQDVSILLGDSSEEGVLESSGIEKMDLFIAATDSQSRNIITAQLVKMLGVRKSIAITANHRYQALGKKLDIDSIICSNDAVVSSVLEIIRKAHIKTIYSFYEDDVEIVELEVDPTSPIVDRTLKDMELPREVLVAFIVRKGIVSLPSGETRIEAGDIIGLVSAKAHIAILETVFGGHDGV